MPRQRSVGPQFWDSTPATRVGPLGRLLLLGCYTLADDEGLLRWDPDELRELLFSSDPDVTTDYVMAWMSDLVDAGIVLPYRGGRSQIPLAYIRDFERDHKTARPKPSRHPAPDPRLPRFVAAYVQRDHQTCGLCGGPIFLSDHTAAVLADMTPDRRADQGLGPGSDLDPAPGTHLGADGVSGRTLVRGIDLSEGLTLRVLTADGGTAHPSNVLTGHAGCLGVPQDVAETSVGVLSRWHYLRVTGLLFDRRYDEETLMAAVDGAITRAHAAVLDTFAVLSGPESQPVDVRSRAEGSQEASALSVEEPTGAVAGGPLSGVLRLSEGLRQSGGSPIGEPAENPWLGACVDSGSGEMPQEVSLEAFSTAVITESDHAVLTEPDMDVLTKDSVSVSGDSLSPRGAIPEQRPTGATKKPLTCGNSFSVRTHGALTETSPTSHPHIHEGSPLEVEREVGNGNGGVDAQRPRNARAREREHDAAPAAAPAVGGGHKPSAFGAPPTTFGQIEEANPDSLDPSAADVLLEKSPRSIEKTDDGSPLMPHPTPAPLDVAADQGGLFDMDPVVPAEPKKRRQPSTWTAERKEIAHSILKPWWTKHGTGWGQTYGTVFGVIIAALKNGVEVQDLTEAMDILGQERMAIGGGSITVAIAKAAKRRAPGSFQRNDAAYLSGDAYTQREM